MYHLTPQEIHPNMLFHLRLALIDTEEEMQYAEENTDSVFESPISKRNERRAYIWFREEVYKALDGYGKDVSIEVRARNNSAAV